MRHAKSPGDKVQRRKGGGEERKEERGGKQEQRTRVGETKIR